MTKSNWLCYNINKMINSEQIFFLDSDTENSLETIKMHAELLEEYRKTRTIPQKTHDKVCVDLAYSFLLLGETAESLKLLSKPRKEFWRDLRSAVDEDSVFAERVFKLASLMKRLGIVEDENQPEINVRAGAVS